jgi:hypothetical protein
MRSGEAMSHPRRMDMSISKLFFGEFMVWSYLQVTNWAIHSGWTCNQTKVFFS